MNIVISIAGICFQEFLTTCYNLNARAMLGAFKKTSPMLVNGLWYNFTIMPVVYANLSMDVC